MQEARDEIGVVTVRPFNRQPARLYFKFTPDPNDTFFFVFTCTTQCPWGVGKSGFKPSDGSIKAKAHPCSVSRSFGAPIGLN